jgi:hypothetical protein
MSDPVRDPPAPILPVGVLSLVIAGIADFAANTVRQGLTGLTTPALSEPADAQSGEASPPPVAPVNAGGNAPILFLALVGVALLAAVLASRSTQAPVTPTTP